MEVTNIWGEVIREWGYEIRVDYTDGEQTYNECLTFPDIPDEKELKNEIERRRQVLENGKLYFSSIGQL